MSRSHSVVQPLLVFLLAAVVLISAGCSGSEQERQAAAEKASEPAGDSSRLAGEMTALLPVQGEVEGWALSGDPRIFVPDNLWEYINGGAEGYLVYKFEAVITADCETSDGSLQAVVDIYRMADQLCGFGIYSAERNSLAPRVDVGAEGYLTDNALHFWQGPYYVKVTAFQTGKGDLLEVLAGAVSARLDAPAGNPSQLAAFPENGLQAGTQRYLAQDVLGHSELKNGFIADYESGGSEFKLFFILHDNLEQAARSYRVYKEFMEKYGRNVEEPEGMESPLFTAQDSYYGKVVAVQSGRAVIGILGLDDPEQVNSYLQELARNLSSQGLV
ncbi:MAG: hypothetical protein FVQ81_04080 [Candidatus Glassbacteria bacterium]|nr:hypothetical protein [Candidatus Glassbacteria bacterium]